MKTRLDSILVEKGLAPDIETARSFILAGEIYVNDSIADKPGSLISKSSTIRTKEKCPFVSRGGYKLEKGLTSFGINVTDYTCVDIGASTGGFTDCLLQKGAGKVFAVDVAYGQLAWKIRQDPRVVVLERFNARNINLAALGNASIDLVVMDASFISITKILPSLASLFSIPVNILTLIKPQFELPRLDIGPGGVVSDPTLHEKAIKKINEFILELGWISKGVTTSPIKGPKGNTEFLMHIVSL